jgi:hypothetical protein
MSCTHPRHPAITHDGTYCCEDAKAVASAQLYYEPLQRTNAELEKEDLLREILGDSEEPLLNHQV